MEHVIDENIKELNTVEMSVVCWIFLRNNILIGLIIIDVRVVDRVIRNIIICKELVFVWTVFDKMSVAATRVTEVMLTIFIFWV